MSWENKKTDNGVVLVVDDAIENIMVIEAILEQEYCVLSAENGQQAIDICCESSVNKQGISEIKSISEKIIFSLVKS